MHTVRTAWYERRILIPTSGNIGTSLTNNRRIECNQGDGPQQSVCDEDNTIQPFNWAFNFPLGPI